MGLAMADRAAESQWTLACDAVRVRRGGREAIGGVSVRIAAGECVSVIGPNGCGKTTLLLALLGILKPAAGRVTLNGVPLGELSARRRGQFAAYVPQTVEHVPAFRVFDVAAGGRFPHLSPMRALSREDEAIVLGALERCGIAHLADRPANGISAGERQRAMLAAALAQDPQILFLDEPNTALDPAHQIDLLRLLREWRAAGRAMMLVSHDLQLPAMLGGRVLALRDGRIVADGSADELLRAARLGDVYGAEFEEITNRDGRRLVIPRW